MPGIDLSIQGEHMITVTKTKDPVCGREVGTDSKFNSYYMGKVYYFCSVEDKLRFDRGPRDYLNRDRAGAQSGGGRSQ
jgi:YHS domain-containing protein